MEKEQLEKYINQGLSTYEIAEKINVSRSTIRYWLNKFKLETKFKEHLKEPKKCSRCGETDPSKFYGRKKTICGKCHSKYTTQKGREKKLKAVEYKGGKCEICGYDKCINALDFHHKDPSQKDLSFKSKRGWSWNKLKVELDKCILVCSNCHREIHFKSTDSEIKRQYISKESKICYVCKNPVQKVNSKCLKCFRKSREKIKWPDIQILLEMIKTKSFLSLSKELGVSDTAIRKRIKNHSISNTQE